jgi:pilus assembly protein CpaC
MTALGRIRATVLTMAFAAMALLAVAPATAQSPSYMRLSAADVLDNTPVYLGVNKSMVIELPRPAGDVLVSNPAIADAVLRTSTRLYLIGVKLGQANIFLFDAAGSQIASFDVYVEADLTALNQLLAEAIPEGFVRADAMNGNIVLRGQVPSASASSRAQEITVGMLDGSSAGTEEGAGGEIEKHVVNLLTITGEEQVALKVTIAEVQRTVVKQLGINVTGSFDSGDVSVSSPTGGLSPLGPSLGVDATAGQIRIGLAGSDGSIQATLQALDETNMIRTLAEPTLTAVSGETADFLAGGEFPFVTGIDRETGTRTIEFKEFGVQLAFTPVVLSEGRISLKMRAEVSEISAVSNGVPVLSSRRAETTVELPSGGAFAIGGLVQQNTRHAAGGFPVLQQLPILGALFSSKSFRDDHTELVMIVAAYLVKPAAPQALARPDDNLMPSGDAEAYFMNRLTRVYGSTAQAPAQRAGQVGFTFD